MGPDPRFIFKRSPQAPVPAWRAAGKLAGLGLVMMVSACAGPAKQSSPITAAEQLASQVIIARCSKSSNQKEDTKLACLFFQDVFAREGVRWAVSRLNPDGSLPGSREVFDVALRKRVEFDKRGCMNSLLAREKEKGPPNLDPLWLGPQQAVCLLVAKQFFEGANALADEAISNSRPERTTK